VNNIVPIFAAMKSLQGKARALGSSTGSDAAALRNTIWNRPESGAWVALVALMPQWRQDDPDNRPPTRAIVISAMGHVADMAVFSALGRGSASGRESQVSG
jgi:hypothetical protein